MWLGLRERDIKKLCAGERIIVPRGNPDQPDLPGIRSVEIGIILCEVEFLGMQVNRMKEEAMCPLWKLPSSDAFSLLAGDLSGGRRLWSGNTSSVFTVCGQYLFDALLIERKEYFISIVSCE
jgi:hypothetical protein